MANDTDEPNGNRATIALVYRTVDDLGKTVEAHFGAVRLQLEYLRSLPADVERHGREIDGLTARVAAIENDDQSQLTAEQQRQQQRRVFRTERLPAYFFGALGVFFAGLNIYLYLHK